MSAKHAIDAIWWELLLCSKRAQEQMLPPSDDAPPRTPPRKAKDDDSSSAFSPQTQPVSPLRLSFDQRNEVTGWDLLNAGKKWHGLLVKFVQVVNMANDSVSGDAKLTPEKRDGVRRAMADFSNAMDGEYFEDAMTVSIDTTLESTSDLLLRDELVVMRAQVFKAQQDVMDALVCVNGIVASA